MFGCRAATVEPSVVPQVMPPPASDEPVAEVQTDPVAEATAMFEAAGIDETYVSDRELGRLGEQGMTNALATAALEVLATDCTDVRTPTCGQTGQDKVLREGLVKWLREHGELSSAPVLLRLDHFGDYAAGHALEAMLTRRMQASLPPCAAPSEAKIAAARAELSSFVVLEHRKGRLAGRAATADELDDLAYFLAAVGDNGVGVGEATDDRRSGATPNEADQRDRKHALAALEHAQATGDHALTVQAGSDYLHTLGYPGAIDLSRETDMFWGGARFSYVMRDVALAAEVEGEHALAASLYRRANPGGGACGTSVHGRISDQTEGLIRSEEAQGQCRAVVVERLADLGLEPYGPKRLAEAGYDVGRLYRGALLTRHREGSEAELRAAIGRAPAGVREEGLARLSTRGPEAWERELWAVENFMRHEGRAGMEHVLTLVDDADAPLRARMIAAIGSAGERGHMGTCDDDGGWLRLRGSSGGPPTVRAFGEDCDTWLDDGEADAIAGRLLPYLRDADADVRASTAMALGYLAAPSARRPLVRALARAKRAEARCEADGDDGCYDLDHVVSEAEQALETFGELTAAQTGEPWESEWDRREREEEERRATLTFGPTTAPNAMQRTDVGQP